VGSVEKRQCREKRRAPPSLLEIEGGAAGSVEKDVHFGDRVVVECGCLGDYFPQFNSSPSATIHCIVRLPLG
jgi:hypothetical protein